MINRETLLKKIESLPPYLFDEINDYIDFIQFKEVKRKSFKANDITLASEKSLAKEWLRPEEDDAWGDL